MTKTRFPVTGSVRIPHKRVADAGTTANVTIVSGVTSQITHVHRLLLSTATADNFTLKSNTTILFGPLYLAANSGIDLDLAPYFYECGEGEDLVIVKGSSATVMSAQVFYTQQPSITV